MLLQCAGMVPSQADQRPGPENNRSVTESQTPRTKDANKKKKVNRRAKLKQSKLDVRREQWLSQGKNKIFGQNNFDRQNSNGRDSVNESSENGSRDDNQDNSHASSEQGERHDSNSCTSFSDRDSSRGSKASVEEDDPFSSEYINSKIQTPDSSQDEDHEHEHEQSSDVEDDWEAAADALNIEVKTTTTTTNQETIRLTSPSTSPSVTVQPQPQKPAFSIEEGTLKPEYKIKSPNPSNRASRSSSCRAWRPDDACRPNSLPKLSKVNSFPAQSCRPLSQWSGWSSNSNANLHSSPVAVPNFNSNLNSSSSSSAAAATPVPLSCPICYEDLDTTDSNFSPCPCGFRLCLFCHKRIMEQDARCPGCRKRYTVTDTAAKAAVVRLPRSFSMSYHILCRDSFMIL